MFTLNTLLPLLAAAAASPLGATPDLAPRQSGSIAVTPHDRYSSSTGVLGCKIDVNRVAYWPLAPSCDTPCVKVTSADSGRAVHLLHIDQSGGAYDISYDAWNYLATGASALEAPAAGGQTAARWEYAGIEACADVLNGTALALPFAAASPGWLAGCAEGSWARQNYELYNIYDPVCRYGYDEKCDWTPGQGDPVCPHTLGAQPVLDAAGVWNIDYPTGELSLAM
ncbi:hypothetical protein F5X99DRAFT_432150 [Biscogniauxia marginata]|nr:hypothetical protein F5X99DRAFT_432150 [Biscogniauxia marginata]